jgi:hypothetical protein
LEPSDTTNTELRPNTIRAMMIIILRFFMS